MGDYPKALSYYQRAVEVRQGISPSNRPDMAQSYNNIGSVYIKMGEYSNALSYLQKALEIHQETL
ncbi:unnamed protein product, partial [Rotaria sordida]